MGAAYSRRSCTDFIVYWREVYFLEWRLRWQTLTDYFPVFRALYTVTKMLGLRKSHERSQNHENFARIRIIIQILSTDHTIFRTLSFRLRHTHTDWQTDGKPENKGLLERLTAAQIQKNSCLQYSWSHSNDHSYTLCDVTSLFPRG